MWVWLQHESANVGWAWFSNEHVAASVITITNLMVILCVLAHVNTCRTLQHHTHKQKPLILSYVLDYLLEFESLGYTLVQLMSTLALAFCFRWFGLFSVLCFLCAVSPRVGVLVFCYFLFYFVTAGLNFRTRAEHARTFGAAQHTSQFILRLKHAALAPPPLRQL